MITSLGLVPRVIKKAAKATARGVKTGAKATAKGTVKVAKATAKGVQTVGALALKPLRAKINTLTTRRAKKLAWDRRKSKTPTAAERAEARAWTKKTLSAKGPHGKLLSLLAGANPDEAYSTIGMFGVAPGPLGLEPATIALISASIPALTKLLQGIISAAAKSGAAPADPSAAAPAVVQHETAPVPDFTPYEEPVAAEEIEEADMAGAFGYFSDGYFGDTLGASPQVGAGLAIGLSALAAGAGIFLAYRR